MLQGKCCIQCKLSRDEVGNRLLDCEHMWTAMKKRRGEVVPHAIHKKCIPDLENPLPKNFKWWCKQLFCLSLRSVYDKREAQSFPTYTEHMDKAVFQGRTVVT